MKERRHYLRKENMEAQQPGVEHVPPGSPQEEPPRRQAKHWKWAEQISASVGGREGPEMGFWF